MLVELFKAYADSLDREPDREPWYRFPYADTIVTYFQVVMQEAQIVCEKMGVWKAFGSMAFITDVPHSTTP
jgi:hypothetical protein